MSKNNKFLSFLFIFVAKLGLARMIVYILFYLTKERDFANQLSKTIDKPIYTPLPGDSLINYADFLYSVF